MTAEPTPAAINPVADAYPPPEIAARVCKVGLAKVTTPVPTMIALAVLAGAFISLGALFYTVTMTSGKSEPGLPFGLLRAGGRRDIQSGARTGGRGRRGTLYRE
jgi:formate transporter